MAGAQLSRQRRDNLLTIGCAFLAENMLVDSGAHLPVHQDQFGVDGAGDTLPGRIDQLTEALRSWTVDGATEDVSEFGCLYV